MRENRDMKTVGITLMLMIVAWASFAASGVEPVLVTMQRSWWEAAAPWLQILAALAMLSVAYMAWRIAKETRDITHNQLYTAFIREMDDVENLTNRFRLYLNLVEKGRMEGEVPRMIESYIDWYGDTGVAFFIPDVRDHVHLKLRATKHVFRALRDTGELKLDEKWSRELREYLVQETPAKLTATDDLYKRWLYRRREPAPKGMEMEGDAERNPE